jgi:hypothetical protein
MRKEVYTYAELCGLLNAEPCATGMPCQPLKDDPDQYDIKYQSTKPPAICSGWVLVGLCKNSFPQLHELPVCNKGPANGA